MLDSDKPIFDRYVTDGEKLLWSAQPRGGLQLRKSDWLAIPGSCLAVAFAVFWNYGTRGAPLFFHIIGAVAYVYTFYFLIGRFVHDALVRAQMYYGLTDQRVIIVSEFISTSVQSLPLSGLGTVELSTRRDQSGSICFPSLATPSAPWWAGRRDWASQGPEYLCLEFIENAQQVYDLLLAAQRVDQMKGPLLTSE